MIALLSRLAAYLWALLCQLVYLAFHSSLGRLDRVDTPIAITSTADEPLLAIIPFRHAFPVEIFTLIISSLDTASLHNISIASKRCNAIARISLWRTVHLQKYTDDDKSLGARCEVVRAQGAWVQSARIDIERSGLHTDDESAISHDILVNTLVNLPHLRCLVLSQHGTSPNSTTHFLDVLASASHQYPFRLTSFKADLPLIENGALVTFLASQPNIRIFEDSTSSKTLGDIPATLPPPPPTFLPALTTLRGPLHVLLPLIPGRPICRLDVRTSLSPENVLSLVDALAQSTASVGIERVKLALPENGWAPALESVVRACGLGLESLDVTFRMLELSASAVQAGQSSLSDASLFRGLSTALHPLPNLTNATFTFSRRTSLHARPSAIHTRNAAIMAGVGEMVTKLTVRECVGAPFWARVDEYVKVNGKWARVEVGRLVTGDGSGRDGESELQKGGGGSQLEMKEQESMGSSSDASS